MSAHPLGLLFSGLYGLPDSLFEKTGFGKEIPLAAQCFAGSLLAVECSDGTTRQAAESMLNELTDFALPFGITFYDFNQGPAFTKDAFHSFVGTNERATTMYLYSLTRKTAMSAERQGMLRTQLGAHTMDLDEDAIAALLSMRLHDTRVLCVASKKCLPSFMRRALAAFADSVPPEVPFGPCHLASLHAALSTLVTRPIALTPAGIQLRPCGGEEEGADDISMDWPCVCVGGAVLALPPDRGHAWEVVPRPAHAPSQPGRRTDRASRWKCPSCAMPIKRDDPSPSHWCATCAKCNLCAGTTTSTPSLLHQLIDTPCQSPLPPCDVDLGVLLSKLDARNVILVVLALLCEQKVLVLSEDIGILGDVLMGLYALLQPFELVAARVSVGHASGDGVRVEVMPWLSQLPLSHYVSFSYPSPTQLRGADLACCPQAAVTALARAQMTSSSGGGHTHADADAAFDVDALLPRLGCVNYHRVRLAFLSVLVSLFRSYRMYYIDGSCPSSRPSFDECFASAEFLSEQAHDESRSLLAYCMKESMLVQQFIAERHAPSHGPPDIFDQMCLSRMQRRASVYDSALASRYEGELLVRVCAGQPFTLRGLSAAATGVTSSLSWVPCVAQVTPGRCQLLLYRASAALEDAWEEYVQLAHACSSGSSAVSEEQVQAAHQSCTHLLSRCDLVIVPLQFDETHLTPQAHTDMLFTLKLDLGPGLGGGSVTLGCETSEDRREWICRLKARLRRPAYTEGLARVYLGRREGEEGDVPPGKQQ